MSEHERLRTRLKNVGRNVVEYRMTVQEAKDLLAEFDNVNKKPLPTAVIVRNEEVEIVHKILDGGTFQ